MSGNPEDYELVFVIRAQKYNETHGEQSTYARVECPIVHGLFFFQSVDEYRDPATNGLNAYPANITQHTGFFLEGQQLSQAQGGGFNPSFTKKLYFKSGDTGAKLWTLRDLGYDKLRRADSTKTCWVNAQSGNTHGVGISNPAVQGTAAADNDGTTSMNRYDSLAGTMAGVISANFSLVRVPHSPTFIARIKTGSDVSQLQLWVGLGDAAPTTNAGPTNHMAFRYSTSAGDTGWVASVSGGTQSVSPPVVTAGTTLAVSPFQVGPGTAPSLLADTEYTLMIRVDGPNRVAYFSLDGGITETAMTTNLPQDFVDLGFFVVVAPDSLVSRSIRLSRCSLESA